MNSGYLRVAGKVVALFWMILFLAVAVVRYYYTRTMPEEPDTQSGKTVAVSVFFGETVYIDDVEANILHGLNITFSGATVFLLVLGLAGRLQRPANG